MWQLGERSLPTSYDVRNSCKETYSEALAFKTAFDSPVSVYTVEVGVIQKWCVDRLRFDEPVDKQSMETGDKENRGVTSAPALTTFPFPTHAMRFRFGIHNINRRTDSAKIHQIKIICFARSSPSLSVFSAEGEYQYYLNCVRIVSLVTFLIDIRVPPHIKD